jgi:F-box-like
MVDTLPNEITTQILSYIDQDDISAVRSVSLQFYENCPERTTMNYDNCFEFSLEDYLAKKFRDLEEFSEIEILDNDGEIDVRRFDSILHEILHRHASTLEKYIRWSGIAEVHCKEGYPEEFRRFLPKYYGLRGWTGDHIVGKISLVSPLLVVYKLLRRSLGKHIKEMAESHKKMREFTKCRVVWGEFI